MPGLLSEQEWIWIDRYHARVLAEVGPLLGEEDAIVSDSLNHASIIDGVQLCKAKRYRFANSDMNDLLKTSILCAIDEPHDTMRGLLSGTLSPKAIRGLGPTVREKADALVDGLVARGSFDAIADRRPRRQPQTPDDAAAPSGKTAGSPRRASPRWAAHGTTFS